MSEPSWIKGNQLWLYFALAYAITWAIEIPLAAAARGWVSWQPPFASHYLAAHGPMLSALIVTALTSGMSGLMELFGHVFK